MKIIATLLLIYFEIHGVWKHLSSPKKVGDEMVLQNRNVKKAITK